MSYCSVCFSSSSLSWEYQVEIQLNDSVIFYQLYVSNILYTCATMSVLPYLGSTVKSACSQTANTFYLLSRRKIYFSVFFFPWKRDNYRWIHRGAGGGGKRYMIDKSLYCTARQSSTLSLLPICLYSLGSNQRQYR